MELELFEIQFIFSKFFFDTNAWVLASDLEKREVFERKKKLETSSNFSESIMSFKDRKGPKDDMNKIKGPILPEVF